MEVMEHKTEQEVKFFQLLKEAALLKEAYYLADWDTQTGMPEKANEYRGELEGYLNELIFEKENGKEMAYWIEYFTEHPEDLSEFGQKVFKKVKEEFTRNHTIPADEWAHYTKLVAQSHAIWVEAREKQDYQILEPVLEEMVDCVRKFIPLWRQDEKTPYDVLLNQNEPGMTTEKLDALFAEVRDGIIEIRQRLEKEGTAPKRDFLYRFVPKEQQERFSRKVAAQLGYDFNKGRLDDTVHPFMQELNRCDARIATRWNEHDVMFAVLGVMHEAGHGIYEQHIDAKYDYTPFAGGVSAGMHEGQSLFNELVIGSNLEFWRQVYPFFQECTEGAFDDIDVETFYKALKYSQSSLIRIEADSLTYPLHVIIRYEIEKALFNDNLPVKDLAKVWNEKYEEYLGVCPDNDTDGVLQDVHWPTGLFGYFPSYALGFMYATQLYYAMNKDFSMDEVFAEGHLDAPSQWLKEHIHRFGGSKSPSELIMDATGEPLNAKYLLQFLKQVYYPVYGIEE